MGDTAHKTKLSESIMRSPVVFAVKKPVAQRLGWIGRDVMVDDILKAAEGGKVRYMMTSATQSNSGASAYLGYLNSFAGSPETLTVEHLRDTGITGKIRRLLGTVNRTAGSSGWLKDLFLTKYDQYDGMVNYESIIIETNRELAQRGLEPLYVIYPMDGLVIADHPLAYVDRGDAKKEAVFRKLQQYLLSSVHYPSPDVIKEALVLYQTSFRKPSLTVYCLDYSGSMGETGEDDLKGAMKILLDQSTAARFLLQTSARDITAVIPFNSKVMDQWTVTGNDPDHLGELLAKINSLEANGMSLEELASLSSGRVFVGRQDLVRAFRQARGYN